MNDQQRDRDLELARRVSREARNDPSSPYTGKFVGILDGRVVVIADSPEEGLRELRKGAPNRDQGLLVDTRIDYDAMHEVWNARCRA
jgi:hypothetical protein